MPASLALFSGFKRPSTVPAGSSEKAASVGANTVNGPLPLRVSVSPAALMAAPKVVKLPALVVVSRIFMNNPGEAWRHPGPKKQKGS